MTLSELLESAMEDDYYEEEAFEWIEKVGVRPVSHSRRYLYNLAWNHGWRPVPECVASR